MPAKLRHFVAFKFKESATAADRKFVIEAFRGLKEVIHEIQEFETGANISTEKLNKDFTEAFLLTFKNVQDRDAYLVHPTHTEFSKLVEQLVADCFVLDF